jgi:hypothetical protein
MPAPGRPDIFGAIMHKNLALVAASLAVFVAVPRAAVAAIDSPAGAATPAAPSYADLADLIDGTPLVIKAQPRKLALVDAARTPGMKPGWARFYVEAKTEAVIFGRTGVGEQLRYLVDLKLDAKGKPPTFKKQSVLLFARAVAARPGELQLVAPDAQVLWDLAVEARVRGLLGEFYAAGAPQRIAGVREAMFVPGNLAGESETQLFLVTASGEPAAITVARQPGQAPRWTVSFSDLVGDAAVPPRDTLAWYRLACFLPRALPDDALTAGTPADRAAAGQDYRFVLDQLGGCGRTRN